MSFREKFRYWREQRGLSISFLSRRSGESESNLRNWEAGRRTPTLPMIKRLSSVPELGLSEGQMLAWKEQDEFTTTDQVRDRIQALTDEVYALKEYLQALELKQ